MKKTIIICTLICFALGAPAMANLKSLMCVGPYVGYTLGFGDAFKDFEGPGYKFSSDAGITFGGQFHYGLSDKMMLGGELYVQQYSFKWNYDTDFPIFKGQQNAGFAKKFDLSEANYEISDSEMKLNFLASALYALSYMQKAMLMANFGAGIYDNGESNIGIFGGIVYQRMVAATMSFYLMPRVHYIFSDASAFMLQLAVGINFWLGSSGAPISN